MILLITAGSTSLLGGTGRPEDGLLFFLVLLGFLGVILGIIHLADFIKIRIRQYLDQILEGLLP